MSTLDTRSLSLAYGDQLIIDDLNLQVPKGKITSFIGSNGSGKSTLLRAMARLRKPKKGSVILDGKEIHHYSTKEVAKRLAILPQSPIAPEGLTVLQLVKQGRYPYQSWFHQWSVEDEQIVKRALEVTHMDTLSDRPLDSLSGGQRQRAWIAMTLAQGTDIILLDEPTTYLDMTHQIEILDLLFELNQLENRTIVMVLHDLNLASRYSHHVVAIQNKKVYAQGSPEAVITSDLVRNVFGMESQIMSCPLYGSPMCIPYGKGKRAP